VGQSPTWRAVWRQHVTGEDYPEEFEHISFLRLASLQRLAEGLALSADDVVVDLACGAGGPGLWVAKHTGAQLIGRDLSPMAVQRAAERVDGLGLTGRAEFAQGSFEQTGLGTGCADAVMTVDALQYAPDKTKAINEVARILRPGGRLGFVAFELDAERLVGIDGVWDDPVGDYRPLLDARGFRVDLYEQISGWEEDVAAGFGAILDQIEALANELGEAAAGSAALEASLTLQLRPYRGHVIAVATRV
jgi:SAM-dependent methyltransferase